jgi:hypothetical protein
VAVVSGNSLFIGGKILGNRQASTTERYAQLEPDPVKPVADRSAERLADLLGFGNALSGSTVVRHLAAR